MAVPILKVYTLRHWAPPIGAYDSSIHGFRVNLPPRNELCKVPALSSITYPVGYAFVASSGYGIRFVPAKPLLDYVTITTGSAGLILTNLENDRDAVLLEGLPLGYIQVFVRDLLL